MGYTTVFHGSIELQPALNERQIAFLKKLSETRRMRRNGQDLTDPDAAAVGLPGVGIEGEFFVNGPGFAGQDEPGDVLDPNNPPMRQPGLWCHWVPSDDGTRIIWNRMEKFYEYVPWLKYTLTPSS
jgi:hypothetical protein